MMPGALQNQGTTLLRDTPFRCWYGCFHTAADCSLNVFDFREHDILYIDRVQYLNKMVVHLVTIRLISIYGLL
jgi:hypothetical protein